MELVPSCDQPVEYWCERWSFYGFRELRDNVKPRRFPAVKRGLIQE